MTTPYGRKLNWQSRQIIFNLHNYFKLRKRDTTSEEYQEDTNVNHIAAEATGLSWRTVIRVVAEGKSLQNIDGQVSFATMEKRRKTVPKKRIPMDCFIEGLIRRRVLQASIESQNPVSLNVVHKIMKQEDIVKSSHEYLRNLLMKIGFRHMTKKRILIENEKIASHRWEYINKMKKYRDEGRNIVYLDETYLSLDQSKLTNWETDNESVGVIYYSGKGQGLIILHAGGRDGFLKNALQMIKTVNIRDCDMNYSVFSKWVKEKLLPQLPNKSVVVMDNAEYHSSAENPEEIDKLLSDNGHELMRMPLCHQELNPLELIWRDLKQGSYLRDHSFYFLDEMHTALEEIFNEYPQERWDNCIEYVENIESEYFVFNGVFDEHLKNMPADEKNNPGDEETFYTMDEEDEDLY